MAEQVLYPKDHSAVSEQPPLVGEHREQSASGECMEEEIETLAKGCIRSFPYEICRNEENPGSSLTFERLTREAEGKYFVYCDQDDMWLPEKIDRLLFHSADSLPDTRE